MVEIKPTVLIYQYKDNKIRIVKKSPSKGYTTPLVELSKIFYSFFELFF